MEWVFDLVVHIVGFALLGALIGKFSLKFNKNLIIVAGIIVSGIFLLIFPIWVEYRLIGYVAKMKSFGIPFCLGVFLGGVIPSLLIINLFQKLSQKTE